MKTSTLGAIHSWTPPRKLKMPTTPAPKSNTRPPLLFIHGYRGSHLGLMDIADNFPDYTVHCPDVPPFGQSQPLERYGAKGYADFVADYIRQHALERPVLIGHSMGSLIVAAAAAHYPELLASQIVLLAPISVRTPKPVAILHPLASLLPNVPVSYVSTKFLQVGESRQQLRQTLDITYECAKHYTSRGDVRAAGRFSTRYAVGDFDFAKDTLLLSGARDRLISRRATERLARQLQTKHPEVQTEAIFLPNTGHLLNYEQPEEVAGAIRAFIERGAI